MSNYKPTGFVMMHIMVSLAAFQIVWAWNLWKLARFLPLLLKVFLWDLLLQNVVDLCSELRLYSLKLDITRDWLMVWNSDPGIGFLRAPQKANLQLVYAPFLGECFSYSWRKQCFFFSHERRGMGKYVALGIFCIWAFFGTLRTTVGGGLSFPVSAIIP